MSDYFTEGVLDLYKGIIDGNEVAYVVYAGLGGKVSLRHAV